jgi:phage recombination protein Bet
MAQTQQRGRTQTRPRPPQQQAPQQAPNQGAVALVRARLPMPLEAERQGINDGLWRQFCEVVWPSAKTPEGIMLAWQYCKSRNLDPMKRPVHVVPIWSSVLEKMVESVWPGIGELRTTAMRTKDWAGLDDAVLGPMTTATLDTVSLEYPQWAQVTVYRLDRLGQRRAVVGPKVYWRESYATSSRQSIAPNAMWKKRPIGQLVKCAEAAALRAGFPEEIGNTYSSEEMWGQIIDHVPTADGSVPPAPRRADYIEHVAQQEQPTRTAPADPPEPIFDVVDADGVITEYRRSQVADALINALGLAGERRDKNEAIRGINVVVRSNQQTIADLERWDARAHARVVTKYRELTRDLDAFGLQGNEITTKTEEPKADDGKSAGTVAGEAAGSSSVGAGATANAPAQQPHRIPPPPNRERSWSVWQAEMSEAIRTAPDRGRLAELNAEIRRLQDAMPTTIADDLLAKLDDRANPA